MISIRWHFLPPAKEVCECYVCYLFTGVCLSTGRVSVQGVSFRGSLSVGHCLWVSVQGVSVQGGALSRVSVQQGLCPGESLSKGVLSRGSLSKGGLCRGGSLSRESLSRGSLSSRVSVQGSLCPRGVSVWGSLSREVSVRKTPPHTVGYVRTVCILLECILVIHFFHKDSGK